MEGTLKGIHILVVEDDPDTRELLKVLLQMQGGAVTTAASVPEALSAYDVSPPHVIVADIGMPDYNGYTLIGRVRARDREKGSIVPAIALTAYIESLSILLSRFGLWSSQFATRELYCRVWVRLSMKALTLSGWRYGSQ